MPEAPTTHSQGLTIGAKIPTSCAIALSKSPAAFSISYFVEVLRSGGMATKFTTAFSRRRLPYPSSHRLPARTPQLPSHTQLKSASCVSIRRVDASNVEYRISSKRSIIPSLQFRPGSIAIFTSSHDSCMTKNFIYVQIDSVSSRSRLN